MKAAVVHEIPGTPVYEDVPEPVPAPGETLIRVLAAPINAIDKSRAGGTHYSRPDLPAVAGFVAAGELPDGRRVLLMDLRGTMAERIAFPIEQTFPIPEGLDEAVAAAALNPGLSAWMAIHHRADIAPGSRVLIQGATGVTGTFAVQLAKRRGAGHVVATGRNQAALDRLRGLGADATIRVDQPDDALADAYRHESGEGWDVVVDYLWGHPTEVLIDTLIRRDAEGRTLRTQLVEVGAMAGATLSLPSAALRSAGLEIVGVGTGTVGERERYVQAIGGFYRLLAAGELRMEVERVPLSRVAEVWHREQGGRRPVLIP